MQFVNPKTKTITFENFLRGLKWCETSKPEDKLKGIIIQLWNTKEIIDCTQFNYNNFILWHAVNLRIK